MANVLAAWHQFSFTLAVTLFVVYICIDGLHAYYTVSVTKRRPLASATTSAVVHILIAFGVFSYTHNYLYVAPIVAGSWVGTYIVVASHVRAGK